VAVRETAFSASPASARVIGYQRWSDLLFLHWRVPPERIAASLPPGLELDLWDGAAWIGLVPFHMSGVRPWWLCAVPGISEFHETNLRTYVTYRGQPGVWFFSLDASNWLAVQVARRRWHLNYHYSRMELLRSDEEIVYRCRRKSPSAPTIGMNATMRMPIEPFAAALGGTLEHFLVERYFLYCHTPRGHLLRGQVHHPPYKIAAVEIDALQENLLAANGIIAAGPPCHAVYSPGVSVAISPLARVDA
jgi:uncharacterized protein YqjF (DUF2071 family)